MSFAQEMETLWSGVRGLESESSDLVERLRCEIEVAERFAQHKSDKTSQYQGLIKHALSVYKAALSAGRAEEAVLEAEKVLAPIGDELKKYTIHCCGHAHIDMNWLWPWQETVSCTRDTFSTVNKLMDAFPDFKFSQDQASTYAAMEDYSPEVFEMIKRRIAEGRWDLTASTWVEGEKNLASGEILCRQMLYTRRYFSQKFGLPYDYVKIDWEPDMFGHVRTLPGILNAGGVTRYYFCRAGKEHKLFWWKGPDGSKVLTFMDDELWYNGVIEPAMTNLLFKFEKDTGLKDYMFMYGVGDHGGGPTRRDLIKFGKMQNWPIYPTLKLSKTSNFYDAVEAANPDLPVVDDELNYIFEGCYTSQSKVKRGNRMSENTLPKAETVAVIAGKVAGFDYPSADLERGWRHAMLCQFHDILPGSGIHATYEYSEGLYQEVAAITESVITRGLREISAKVDTASVVGQAPASDGKGAELGDGLGAGAGENRMIASSTSYSTGSPGALPFFVYNPMLWPRSEVVAAKVWNVDWPRGPVAITNPDGSKIPGQVVDHGYYWGHMYSTIVFPVKDAPSLGYAVYGIDKAVDKLEAESVSIEAARQKIHCPICEKGRVALENEHLRVEFESKSASIVHLIDKATGQDFVPAGGRLGLLEVHQEAHNPMSAWNIGQILHTKHLDNDWTLEVTQRGPYRGEVVCRRKLNDTTFTLKITLDQGSRMIDFHLNVFWLERGNPAEGVPFLKAAFPLNAKEIKATGEIAYGTIERPTDGQEFPALKWADISGKSEKGMIGITLVNENKYGHSVENGVLNLSLIRSSYDPDPLPELGEHNIKYAIHVHGGDFDPVQAMRQGWNYNDPMTVLSADTHSGELPAVKSFAAVEPANVLVSAIKKSEDDDSLIVRIFEFTGKATDTVLDLSALVPNVSRAVLCDAIEVEKSGSDLAVNSGKVSVSIPAYGFVTIKVS